MAGFQSATIQGMARKKQPQVPIELEIDDLAFGGEGVGRLEGQVHFVAGAFPGERVVAVPVRGRKRWQRARLVKILDPSPHRIPPRCSHTGLCGGCVYQCLDYEHQLEAKAGQVRENISRIAHVDPPEPDPPVPAPDQFHYRNKMEFSFAPRAWDPAGVPDAPTPDPALGLHVPGRFDAIFDVIDCALTDPEVNELLALIREFARQRGIGGYHGRHGSGVLRHLVTRISKHTGEWLLALVVRSEDPNLAELASLCVRKHPRIAGFILWIHEGLATVARADRQVVLHGKERIVERLLDLEFELSASSFFQTNSAAAAGLLEELRRIAPRVGTILDLYCGVGTLGLALAGQCEQLVGIESVEAAVADARRNAERNGITNARFETAKTEDWLPLARQLAADLVIVDPPRAGLHPRALSGLVDLSPPRIIYVSCNPSTLARDIETITSAGYRADRMRVFDLFPHTPHVETVMSLSRQST